MSVLDNKAVRRTLRAKREKLATGQQEVHTEVLHNLCLTPNIIMVTKLVIRRDMHVAYTGNYWNIIPNFNCKP